MKSVNKILLVSILLYSVVVVPVFADETEWVDPQEKTLRLMETFAREGFLIEATDFYDNSALITIYDSKHNVATKNITRINDYLDINDRLNITVINLQVVSGNVSAGHGLNVIVDQWVKIETRVAGKPSPKLSIIPKRIELNNKTVIRHTFIPGSEVPINFSVRNEGKGKLKNITLRINTPMQRLYEEKLNYEINELGPGNESDVITVRFQAPYADERKSFLISAEIKGYDPFGKLYEAADSMNIEIKPQFDNKIELKKYVSEKVYMGDIAIVTLSVRNNGSQKFDNVNLTDNLLPGINPLDSNLSWNFSLGPLEQKTISYVIRPQKPGTYIFLPGSSFIEYQEILDYNRKPAKLIVNGPFVDLKKSADSYDIFKGEAINITVMAKNIGDATAIVKIRDPLPINYILTSENESFDIVSSSMVLHPGESASLSYILTTYAAGSFMIPPAKASIYDQILYQDERYKQSTTSNELSIKVREPIKMEIPSVKTTPIPKKPDNAKSIEKDLPSSTPKSIEGFGGYIFIVIFVVIMIIKKLNFRN